MRKWCVFYADGTSWDSSLGHRPEDVPGLGVIVIVVEHEDPLERPYLQHMADYYVWKGDYWQGCDLFYLWQYMFVEKHAYRKVALAGQTVPNDMYMEIRERAKALRDEWYGQSDV